MDIDVTNVIVFDVIRALIRVALNQNRNTVFIRSTAFCFILTVAIYSSFLCTLSISRLFRVIALYDQIYSRKSIGCSQKCFLMYRNKIRTRMMFIKHYAPNRCLCIKVANSIDHWVEDCRDVTKAGGRGDMYKEWKLL